MAVNDHPSTTAHSAPCGVTWRAVLLGLLLIPVNCWWIVHNEVRWNLLQGTSLQLFVTSIVFLFALTLVNLGLKRWRVCRAFSSGELLTVFILLVVSCTVAGRDTLANLVPVLGHGAWFDSEENQWNERLFPLLPRWMLVWDRASLEAYWGGHASIYQGDLLRPWIGPAIAWSIFFLVLLGMMLCINTLVRKPWTDHERLSYPLMELPLAMTEVSGEGPFYRSRLMWIGFALPAFIATINQLHAISPLAPELPVRGIDLSPYLTGSPWNAIPYLGVSFFPFAIGMAFFLPLELSFSCWVFFFLTKLQMVIGGMLGQPSTLEMSYLREQAVGAWLGIGIVSLWGTRRYLSNAFAHAFGKRAKSLVSDLGEPMPYRLAFVGLALGAAFLLLFWLAAGMTTGFIILFFAVYLLLSVGFTRVRAEVGPPSDLWMSPDLVFISVLGTYALGPSNLVLMALLYWMNSAYRNHPMPHQLEAFQFGERARMNKRHLLAAMLAGILVALLAAWWTNLGVCFREGAEANCVGIKRWVAASSYRRMDDWLHSPREPSPTAALAVGAGMGVVGLLRFLRFKFLWWPLHPAGYALAVSEATDNFWMPLFLGWFLKFTLIRYGGHKALNSAKPLFLGLILGDYVSNAVWSIVRAWMGAGLVKAWWTA